MIKIKIFLNKRNKRLLIRPQLKNENKDFIYSYSEKYNIIKFNYIHFEFYII